MAFNHTDFGALVEYTRGYIFLRVEYFLLMVGSHRVLAYAQNSKLKCQMGVLTLVKVRAAQVYNIAPGIARDHCLSVCGTLPMSFSTYAHCWMSYRGISSVWRGYPGRTRKLYRRPTENFTGNFDGEESGMVTAPGLRAMVSDDQIFVGMVLHQAHV